MGDREITAYNTNNHQHREYGNRKGKQQNSSDTENQSNDQHTERWEQENLSEKASNEGAPERVRDGVRNYFQVLATEHDQTEAKHGQAQEDPDNTGDPAKRAHYRPGLLLRRFRLQCRGIEAPNLSANLSTHHPHVSTESEDVTRNHTPPMNQYVSPDAYEVTKERAVHVSVSVYHQQVAVETLLRADAVVPATRCSTGYGKPYFALSSQHRPESILDYGRLAEVAQVY